VIQTTRLFSVDDQSPRRRWHLETGSSSSWQMTTPVWPTTGP